LLERKVGIFNDMIKTKIIERKGNIFLPTVLNSKDIFSPLIFVDVLVFLDLNCFLKNINKINKIIEGIDMIVMNFIKSFAGLYSICVNKPTTPHGLLNGIAIFLDI
jgi:hypothetical protein